MSTLRLRPPLRPRALAAASPALVRSTIISRSIVHELDYTPDAAAKAIELPHDKDIVLASDREGFVEPGADHLGAGEFTVREPIGLRKPGVRDLIGHLGMGSRVDETTKRLVKSKHITADEMMKLSLWKTFLGSFMVFTIIAGVLPRFI